MALITPPENRPYSALIPEVSTCVSSIASSMNRFCGDPNRLSFTSTPLIMKMLSKAKAPWIATCPALGVLVLRPGDSVEMPYSVRDVASALTSSCLIFSPTVGVASGGGTVPTTCTVSDTLASPRIAPCSTVPPSGTVTVLVKSLNDGIVTVIV